MKKFTMLMVLFCSVLSVFATDYKTESNVAYLKDCNLQIGTDGTIDLYLKSERPIGTVNVIFDMPAGVTINSVVSDGAAVTFNELENNLLLGKGEPYYSTGKIATLNVTVAADAQPGLQSMSIAEMTIVEPDLTTYMLNDINSDLTLQKTALFTPMPEDYSLEIVPFAVKKGDTSVDVKVNLKNAEMIDDVTFSVSLPSFMQPANQSKKIGKKTYSYAANTNTDASRVDNDETTFTIFAEQDGEVWNYTTVNSGGDAFLPNTKGELAFTIPMVLTGEQETGIYTIKMSDISVEAVDDNYDPIANYTGEYLATVIVGQPAAQEAILYGNYSSTVASTFSTALKNVAIADVTAATVAEDVKFQDVLVNEKGGNSYYTRNSAEYGTTVLPYVLEANENLKLYKVSEMTSQSITIEEAADVPADETCIFKGTINVEGPTPSLGIPSGQTLSGTTFKGTYEATNIDSGDGYYIAADGKFYGDGASIAPFRGYFEGSIAGVKEFRINLQTPDGIVDVTDQFSESDIYNLQGIRVQNAKKGVNIVGGKKVYVK